MTNVTIYGHIVVMKDAEPTVRVAALKARLSSYLRMVRRGRPVTVYDRDTPIARLVPYTTDNASLRIRPAQRRLRDVPLPPPLGRRVDSLAALLEGRQSSR